MARMIVVFGMICFFGWLSFFWPSVSEATVVPYRSLDQMIQKSSRVVRARVMEKKYLWGPGRRHIYTDYKMKVLEHLKGDVGPEITVRQLGGVMNGVVMRIPGSAHYKLNEEVVLFLEVQRRGGYYFVMDLAAGKFEVVRIQGQPFIQRDVHHVAFHRPLGITGKSPSVFHLSVSEKPLSVAALRLAISRLQQAQSSVSRTPTKKPTWPKLRQAGPKVLPLSNKRAKILLMMRRLRRAHQHNNKHHDHIHRPSMGTVIRSGATKKKKPALPGFILRKVTTPKVSAGTKKGGK